MINKFYVFILLSFLSLQACAASRVITEDYDAGELGELPPRFVDPPNPGLQFPSNGNQNANNGYNPDNSNDDDDNDVDIDSGLVQSDAGVVVVVVPPQDDSGTVTDSGTVVVADSGSNSPDEDDAGTVVVDSGTVDQDDAGSGPCVANPPEWVELPCDMKSVVVKTKTIGHGKHAMSVVQTTTYWYKEIPNSGMKDVNAFVCHSTRTKPNCVETKHETCSGDLDFAPLPCIQTNVQIGGGRLRFDCGVENKFEYFNLPGKLLSEPEPQSHYQTVRYLIRP